MSKYRATGYYRLSYTTDRSMESDSIANQKRLIEDFVKAHPDIELVSEKEDDGYSGILFDRPAFQEMMRDIMDGKINCVIVKDLSRLGREYIETGRYLRRIFPAYGVRFIAINDNIDTANEHSGDDLNISIKNIINDAYCHDISVKTRSALLAKRKNGEYVGACPVYGYQKSPDNRNQLIVDEETARVVRNIFRRRIDGASAKRIADELNRLGVLSPLAYKIRHGFPHPTGGFSDSKDAKWSATTVRHILQDETYIGTLIQGRMGTYNHKLKSLVTKTEDEWIRTEGAHEPIIRKQDFDLVQQIMGLDTRTAPDGDSVYLFSGMLICGCCGARMTRKTNLYHDRKYVYYYCRTGKKNGCSHPVMLREEDLAGCVLESLQAHIRCVVSLDELLDSINVEQIDRELIAGYQAQITEHVVQMDQISRYRATLYENLVNGLLNKREYQHMRNDYAERAKMCQDAIDKLKQEMERVQNNSNDRQKWMQHFKSFATMNELDRRAVITLIQSIRVVSKTEFAITFRYQMEYEASLEHLRRSQRKEAV